MIKVEVNARDFLEYHSYMWYILQGSLNAANIL